MKKEKDEEYLKSKKKTFSIVYSICLNIQNFKLTDIKNIYIWDAMFIQNHSFK